MTIRLTIIALTFLGLSTAAAQEFKVYTTVSAAVAGEPDGPILARSNTMMRAGKSYDYMEEFGEVVICNPVTRRFTIVYQGRLGTRVAFDELNQYLNVGRRETEEYARKVGSQPGQVEVAESLMFQLLPSFDVAEKNGRLSLTSPHWSYDATVSAPPSPEHATRYADYADAAARLNFVLHPQSFYPAVRQALNDELRKRDQIPTRVALRANVGHPIQLVADHKFTWTLEDYDRRQLRKFDRMAESEDIEWIGFRDYQQRVLRSN